MTSDRLAATLPDAGEATFVPIAAVAGGVLGSGYARWRRFEREDVRRWTEDGAFAGAIVGLAAYLIALAAELL